MESLHSFLEYFVAKNKEMTLKMYLSFTVTVDWVYNSVRILDFYVSMFAFRTKYSRMDQLKFVQEGL